MRAHGLDCGHSMNKTILMVKRFAPLLFIGLCCACSEREPTPSVDRMLRDLDRLHGRLYPNNKHDERMLAVEWRYETGKQKLDDENVGSPPNEGKRERTDEFLSGLRVYLLEAPVSDYHQKMTHRHFHSFTEAAFALSGAEEARRSVREVAGELLKREPPLGRRDFERVLKNADKQIAHYQSLIAPKDRGAKRDGTR